VSGMYTNRGMRLLRRGFLCAVLCWVPSLTAQRPPSMAGLAFIGTLDKRLLIYDENQEEVVGEIPLYGIPRQTALSHDQTKLIILTADMAVETVDLQARQMINHFELADGRSRPRMSRGGGGIVLDPTGRYLYATFRAFVKEVDYYRMDPPQFVKVDLQAGSCSIFLLSPRDGPGLRRRCYLQSVSGRQIAVCL